MTGTATIVAWPQRLLDGPPPYGPRTDSTEWLAAHRQRHSDLPRRRIAGPDLTLLEIVERSGLTGRGGAGFPTATKMRSVAAGARRPVVVANGSEGEPASAKDTLLLARSPHLVLDGIQLAARAVGADVAHLVVHRGRGLSEKLGIAVAERRDIDDVQITVHEIPARYVASEESAVVHWLNGGEAKPTFTPPRPFEQGVARRPTLVNNVETLAHLALIARHGAAWFREVGDPEQPGTLLLTVRDSAGRGQIVEVPTGTAIGAVAECAGVELAESSAVLVGGYFGTWLPASRAWDVPLTHRHLHAAGGALGAGVLAPLPVGRCGLAETSRVADYLAAHGAGQCGPCVNGLPSIAGALRMLAFGPWDDRVWPSLQRWLGIVPGRGACRHPDGFVRLVASALAVFADDVADHRAGRPCRRAGASAWLPVPSSAAALDAAGWR
jgi:NADH:ubiquinone oxidoreductase subunit F (NADH-binding)